MPGNISKEDNVTPKERQERELEDGSENIYVRSRAMDRSWWIKTAYVLEKYRVLVLAVGAAIGAFGFGFTTPKEHYEEIKQYQNTIIAHQSKSDSVLQSMDVTLNILVAAQCMDRSRTELAFMQLDCSRYIQYRVDNPKSGGKP